MTDWTGPVLEAAFQVAKACVILSIPEAIAARFFWRPLFGIGPVVMREHIDISRTRPEDVGRSFDTSEGKVKVLSANECLFGIRFRFRSTGISTPFPVKGKILWHQDEAKVVGRIPIFPLIFVIEWLIGTVWIGVNLALSQSLWYIAMLAAMFAFGCGFYFFSVRVEIARAKGIIDEFKQTVQQAPSEVPAEAAGP